MREQKGPRDPNDRSSKSRHQRHRGRRFTRPGSWQWTSGHIWTSVASSPGYAGCATLVDTSPCGFVVDRGIDYHGSWRCVQASKHCLWHINDNLFRNKLAGKLIDNAAFHSSSHHPQSLIGPLRYLLLQRTVNGVTRQEFDFSSWQ